MKKILKKVAKGKISPIEAYNLLYSVKPTKARYIVLKMKIKNANQFLNGLLGVLFFFPIPISLGRRFIMKKLKEENVDPEIYNIVRDAGGGFEAVISNDEALINVRFV